MNAAHLVPILVFVAVLLTVSVLYLVAVGAPDAPQERKQADGGYRHGGHQSR